MYCIDFFFSSRRRHTRCLSDWSSDVCSSDLVRGEPAVGHLVPGEELAYLRAARRPAVPDRKSTRLNSSHLGISYAVFCLKKKTSPGRRTDRARIDNAPAFFSERLASPR